MSNHGINFIKYFKKKMLGNFSQKAKIAESAQEFHRISSNKIVMDMDIYSCKDRKFNQSRHETDVARSAIPRIFRASACMASDIFEQVCKPCWF
jgi:hypothetical protein